MAPTLAALRLLSTRLSAADTSGFALKSTTDTDRFAEYISRPVAGNSDDQHLHAALRTRRSRMGRRDFRLYGHLSLQRRPPNNTRASTEDAIELAVDSGGFVLSDHRAAFDAVTRHDKAGVQFLDGPGRREAAGWQSNGSDILM